MENENTHVVVGGSIDDPKCDSNDDSELEFLQMEVDAQRQYEALVRRAFTFPY